ncbi:LysR family transcriptional regulator [Saccharopolyspora sp. NPDC002376]
MPLSARVVDLTGYDLLLSVAELGSIGRAARAHRMSQPGASSRLRRLEDQVGVSLLERSPSGAKLTEAGKLVAAWARTVVDAAEDLDAGIGALRADRRSHVRIAASLTIAEYLLPRWLVALREVDPDTVVALNSGNSTEVAHRVRAGEADLGFIEGPDLPEHLDSREIARDELIVVVAPTHRWASRRRSPDAAELARTGLISREPGSGTRLALERALREYDAGPLASPLLELSSTTAIKAAVAEGIGPAVLSAYTVTPELSAGTLVRIPVAGLRISRSLRAIWPLGQPPRGPARDLLAIALRHKPNRP